MKNNNRKSVSALIATILLIVVAVALIAIILTWGKSFTTDSLADTANVVDTSCTGAAITLSDCQIDSDNNLVFFVKNIGSTYSFLSTDEFTFDLTDNIGGFASNVTMSDYTTTVWAGLIPGEMVKVDYNRIANDINGDYINVTVKSAICTNDAIAVFKNCHK